MKSNPKNSNYRAAASSFGPNSSAADETESSRGVQCNSVEAQHKPTNRRGRKNIHSRFSSNLPRIRPQNQRQRSRKPTAKHGSIRRTGSGSGPTAASAASGPAAAAGPRDGPHPGRGRPRGHRTVGRGAQVAGRLRQGQERMPGRGRHQGKSGFSK